MLKLPEQSQKGTKHTGSSHLFLSWVGFISRIIFILWDLWHKGIRQLFTSWGNIQPEVAEVLLTDQDERQRSQDRHSRMTLGPVVSLAVRWDRELPSYSPEDSKSKADDTRVAHLLCRYQSLWKHPLTSMQTTECVGDMWTEQDQLADVSFHCNSLVILPIGKQKMARCLWYCSGAIVFLKKMHCFWRINSNWYLSWLCFFMAYRDGLKLLISWLSNSRDQNCQIWPPCGVCFFLK